MRLPTTEHKKPDWEGMRRHHLKQSMSSAVPDRMRRWHGQMAKDISEIMRRMKLEAWSWKSFIAKFSADNQQPNEGEFYAFNKRTNEQEPDEMRGMWRTSETVETEC